MAVLAFDHRIQTLTGFTSDPAKIDEAFKKLSAGQLHGRAERRHHARRSTSPEPADQSAPHHGDQIAENRDKGSGMNVREVLTAADFAERVIYSIDISQLVAALTSKAQPNRPSTLPPGARAPAHGTDQYRDHGIADQHGQLGSRAERHFRRGQGSFRARSAGCVHALHRRPRSMRSRAQKALERDVPQIGDELHSQYLLTYAPNNQDEAGFHQIIVNVMKPGLSVRTRDGYWIAAQAETK